MSTELPERYKLTVKMHKKFVKPLYISLVFGYNIPNYANLTK